MPKRFSARFNLSRLDFLTYAEEFEEFQIQRQDELKEKLADAILTIQNKKVLFIGDSITSDNLGYRISVTKAANLQAVNGSLSSTDSQALLDSSLTLIKKERPDIVSIMLGTNDSIYYSSLGKSKLTQDEYVSNMKKIVKCAKETGASVLLFEIPTVNEKAFSLSFNPKGKFQSNECIKGYNAALEELATELGIKLIRHDWLSGEDTSVFFEPDGVHLSTEAHWHFSLNWINEASKLTKKEIENENGKG